MNMCICVCYMYMHIYYMCCVGYIMYVCMCHVLNMSVPCMCAMSNVYVCVSHAVCCVFFICFGGTCVHVLPNAMSHVCCVSYVLYMYGVVLYGVCVLLSAVESYVVCMFISTIHGPDHR